MKRLMKAGLVAIMAATLGFASVANAQSAQSFVSGAVVEAELPKLESQKTFEYNRVVQAYKDIYGTTPKMHYLVKNGQISAAEIEKNDPKLYHHLVKECGLSSCPG